RRGGGAMALAGRSGVGGGLRADRMRAGAVRAHAPQVADAREDPHKPEGDEGMGASTDEIVRQIAETRDHVDENLTILERRAAANARRVAIIVAAGVAAGIV